MAEGKAVIVSKAQVVYSDKPVIDTRIEVIGSLPAIEGMEEHARYFDRQAQQIEEALNSSLPGGTYDRLAGRMLARKATHFRVAHFSGDPLNELPPLRGHADIGDVVRRVEAGNPLDGDAAKIEALVDDLRELQSKLAVGDA